MNKLCTIIFIAVTAFASCFASRAEAQFDIVWFTTDSFGGYASGGEFELVGTIGQFEAGPQMSNGEFDLVGGFLAGPQTEANLLLGDVDRSGGVTFLDIAPFIDLLAANQFQGEADCNEDGILNFLDIAPFIAILASN